MRFAEELGPLWLILPAMASSAEDHRTIIPYLTVPDADELIAFVTGVFDGTLFRGSHGGDPRPELQYMVDRGAKLKPSGATASLSAKLKR